MDNQGIPHPAHTDCSDFEPASMVDLLRRRARRQPDNRIYTFLADGKAQEISLTYKELDQRARAIGAWLQAAGAERALLIYPPGLEYIIAFFGCLYAKAVAVPAYPPRPNRAPDRLHSILKDARPTVALTTNSIINQVASLSDQFAFSRSLQWQATDIIDDEIAAEWRDPDADGNTLAFLQYTSGSTARPKGIMVTHGNLLHNQRIIRQAFQQTEQSIIVGWLPLFHDMGLIGNVLQPLYLGAQCILMSPATFLQRPLRWLEAISRYRATTSGGPNFSYELCARKICPEHCQGLDLSSWSVAFNGSEPIHKETLDRFAAAFEPYGFRKQSFFPCYGLAEATLFVSGGMMTPEPSVRTLQKSAIGDNLVAAHSFDGRGTQTIVSCGRAWLDQRIEIVDPQSSTQCSPGQIGEIWVKGPSVAQGYWDQPEESRLIFQAYLADTNEGPFLRTGDLGFIEGEELYVTGRLKDLIIIRGRNHYPQDIEWTVEQSHAALRAGSGAVFAVEVDGEDRLVIVHEIERRYQNQNLAEIIDMIRQVVSEEHDLQVNAVILVKAGSVPKTSSGKIQRRACREAFQTGSLDVIESDILSASEHTGPSISQDDLTIHEILTMGSTPSRQTLLEGYLQKKIALGLRVKALQVHLERPLTKLGLDSLRAIELQNHIESTFGVSLTMESILNGRSISQLASQIVSELENSTLTPIIDSTSQKEKGNEHSLSYGQHRLWFLDQLDPGNPAYNIAVPFSLFGDLNVVALEQAVSEIVWRHEVLRTTFVNRDGTPVQIINPAPMITLPIIDLSSIPTESKTKSAHLAADEDQRSYDLAKGPLLRVILLRLSKEEHLLLLSMHHIVSDGWSVKVFMHELTTLYQAYLVGLVSPLPELSIQYTDFAQWQRRRLQGETLSTQIAYWKRRFSAPPARLVLPATDSRREAQPKRGASRQLKLASELTESVKRLSCNEGNTLFMTLLTGFKVALLSLSGLDDIVVGTPIAGRNRAEFENLIGFFLNTLVLRTDLSGNPTFRDLLGRVRETTLQAYAHQDMPFERLVSEVLPDRDINTQYHAWFVLQISPLTTITSSDLTIKPNVMDLQTTKFDLALNLVDTSDGIEGRFEYNADLYDEAMIALLAANFETALEEGTRQPDIRLVELKNILLQHTSRNKEYDDILRQKLRRTNRKHL